MSTSDEGVSCQRQDSLFEVEQLADTDDSDREFLNEHLLCVELPRTADGFGLTIQGGTDIPLYDKDHGIFITSIKPGSSAQRCKHIEVGDKILEVNGHSLSNAKHGEAVQQFKESKGKVKLLIHKNIGAILEAATITEENLETEAPADPNELNGFSPVGFVVGIAVGCIAVFALRRYMLNR